MAIDIQERETSVRSPGKGALVICLLALVFLFPSIRSAVGLGSGDTKCASWPSRQGEWYSVPPAILTATADYPRIVDKSGVWAKQSFGLTRGWIYAAKTPDGPLAYWAVARDQKPNRTATYDSDGQLIEERFVTWMALNDQARSLSMSLRESVISMDETNVNRMLTDQIKDSIAHCLGY